ncbi:MAG: hypothetical protein Kow006_22220 [Gammaproteobacteria bacterium]
MKIHKPITLLIAGFVLLFLQAETFAAQIVSVTPAQVRAPLGQSFSTTLRWRVAADSSASFPATLVSLSGQFRVNTVNGTVLGTVNRTLSQSVNNTNPVNFTESLFVPASVIQSAHKLGATRIVFVRSFDDGYLVDLGGLVHLVMDITSPSSASFGVSGLALSFEDGSLEKVAQEAQFLRARAAIRHTGSGVVRGVWEVADPTSTAGTPYFRPLTQVREFLTAGGGEKALLSPRLPTDRPGLYLVRFRLTEPALFDSEPVMRYYVSAAAAQRASLGLVTPPHLALLGEETRFAWHPVNGVQAYQLEFYQEGTPPSLPEPGSALEAPRAIEPRPGMALTPAAGLLVPGDQTSVPLTTLTRANLEPGRSYLWRVLAIGADGTVVGESPLRVIRVP